MESSPERKKKNKQSTARNEARKRARQDFPDLKGRQLNKWPLSLCDKRLSDY